MREEIKKMVNELKQDIEVLEAEVKAKSSKLTKLQLIKIQLENILKNEK